MACNFEYKGNMYPPAYEGPMVAHHNAVYKALMNSNIKFETYQDKGTRLRMPQADRLEANKVIVGTRAIYGPVIFINKVIEKTSNNKKFTTEVVDIDVTGISEQLFLQSDAENRVSTEEDNNQFIIDGDVMPSQEQRVYKGIDFEDINTANTKAASMESKFRNLGINTRFLFDTEMEASGKLVGKNTAEYKEMLDNGLVEPDQFAIVVNPNKLYADTVFHEYGHLLIDLLGGANSPRISGIFEDLKSTSIYTQVVEAYPELTTDGLIKEVVATALGQTAEQLYSDRENISNWKKFILWIKNNLNRLMGTDSTVNDELINLASQLLEGSSTDLLTDINTETQLQKDKAYKVKKIVERDLKSLKGIKNEIYTTISRYIKGLENNKNPSIQEYLGELQGIKGELDRLTEADNEYAITAYISTITEQIDNIDKILSNLTTTGKKQLDMVGVMNHKLAAFDLINDIMDTFNDPDALINDTFNETTKENLRTIVTEAANKLSNIKGRLRSNGINQVAFFFTDYFNYGFTEARDKFFVEFNNLPENLNVDRDDNYIQRREEYVERNVNANEESIKERNLALIKTKLRESSADISSLAAQILDEKDINSIIIQLASKVIDDSNVQRNFTILNKKIDALAIFEEFRKNKPGSDPKEIFKGHYHEGSDGNLYLTTAISPEFYITISKLKKAAKEAEEEYGNNSPEHKKALKPVYAFYKNETTHKVPNLKWRDKNYNKVKDTEMYQWLAKQSLENNVKLDGIKSNIIETHNHTLIKLPNIGKSGFEELSSGSLLQNTWESIQRIYKVRSDNTEFGEQGGQSKKNALYEEIKRRNDAGESVEELKDEINMLQVMANEIGDLKSSIPVFFRGQHNLKDQSYDLMSILLMDSYMAEDYYQKKKIQYSIELTMDLVNSKKFNQTSGILRKMQVQILGGDEQLYEKVRTIAGDKSNEAKAFKSMLENRLYGIKTINAEYAQLANSLMAWSATAMLGFNYLAAGANLIQGKIYALIESVGGQHFDRKDLLKGEAAFFGDYKGWIDDLGRTVQTSKTAQLFDTFDLQGEFKSFTNRLNEDARYKALFKKSTLFALNHMGEFYMHGVLMYAMLNRIKAKNADNQFIDMNGKVVTKDKAMSLREAFDVDKTTKKLTLNKHVKKTSFGRQNISFDLKNDKGINEIKGYIGKVANDMYGQYNKEYQSLLQRHVVGKMVFMLRKWIVRGYMSRWRGVEKARRQKELLTEDDKFYSEGLQEFQEGYYTSFIRFTTRIVSELKTMSVSESFNKNYNNLSAHEIANVRKTLADVGVMVLSLITSMVAYSALDDLDDEEAEGVMYLAFFSRRLYSELSFFLDPASTLQILASPAASISYVKDITRFLGQVVEDGYRIVGGEGFETFQSGRNKDDYKIEHRIGDLLPLYKQVNRNIEDTMSYVFNTN